MKRRPALEVADIVGDIKPVEVAGCVYVARREERCLGAEIAAYGRRRTPFQIVDRKYDIQAVRR